MTASKARRQRHPHGVLEQPIAARASRDLRRRRCCLLRRFVGARHLAGRAAGLEARPHRPRRAARACAARAGARPRRLAASQRRPTTNTATCTATGTLRSTTSETLVQAVDRARRRAIWVLTPLHAGRRHDRPRQSRLRAARERATAASRRAGEVAGPVDGHRPAAHDASRAAASCAPTIRPATAGIRATSRPSRSARPGHGRALFHRRRCHAPTRAACRSAA